MIVAIGSDTDHTFRHFLYFARQQASGRLQVVNLRGILNHGAWWIEPGGEAHFSWPGGQAAIRPGDDIFVRYPDFGDAAGGSTAAARWNNLRAGMAGFLQLHRGTVVNRPQAGSHNGSKPLHEYLLRRSGFLVPDSIASGAVEDLKDFCRQGPTVGKALSGIRASCKLVTENMLAGTAFDGPVYLQRRIYGVDVRAHVVGDLVFALSIESSGVDYRSELPLCKFSRIALPRNLERKMIETGQKFGLLFAGWDFKFSSAGDLWCLEANPMPGYSGYDNELGGEISRGLLHVLRGKL